MFLTLYKIFYLNCSFLITCEWKISFSKCILQSCSSQIVSKTPLRRSSSVWWWSSCCSRILQSLATCSNREPTGGVFALRRRATSRWSSPNRSFTVINCWLNSFSWESNVRQWLEKCPVSEGFLVVCCSLEGFYR